MESNLMLIVAVAAIVVVGVVAFLLLRHRGAAGGRGAAEEAAYLEDIDQVTQKKKHSLQTRRPTMIGRIPGKDRKVSYIVVPEPTVGRSHAMIEYKDYGYWIKDQGSVNGTFVNGQKVTAAVKLKHGDSIQLYQYGFKFLMPGMSDADQTLIAGDAEMTKIATPARQPAPVTPGDIKPPSEPFGEDVVEDMTLENFIDDQTISASITGQSEKKKP
ncbi:MAG: FHA domain-containing protein [Gammaproteobacteria bacterium]|nr:FHA domain-containing protein [Gammaproteobacteria bacterium]